MSTLSDALQTEVLYLDGNPDYVVPTSTLAFLSEAADELEAQTALIAELVAFLEQYEPFEGRDPIDRMISKAKLATTAEKGV